MSKGRGAADEDAGPNTIAFARLSDVDPQDIIDLMNDPEVRRHLPLLDGLFDADVCARFVAGKERMWSSHGYGPWALTQGDRFVGWGGLQPEGSDADVGLILHPSVWGSGRGLLDRFLDFGFEDVGLESVIALLPQTRRGSVLIRFGFEPDGEARVGGELFVRYRLSRDAWERARAAKTGQTR